VLVTRSHGRNPLEGGKMGVHVDCRALVPKRARSTATRR